MWELADYSYELPEALIAQTAANPRDSARLMVVAQDRNEHATFSQLGKYLPPDAVIVVNDTKVMSARLKARKATGGAVEIFLLQELAASQDGAGSVWHAMVRSSKGVKVGESLQVITAPDVLATMTVQHKRDDGTVEISTSLAAADLLRMGQIPLPPYIARQDGPSAGDEERYQTRFAAKLGAVAAPTAGLHFTDELVGQLKTEGFDFAHVTLHVGLGTFAPVRVKHLAEHSLHGERYEVSQSAAALINSGRPIVAIGTTVVRTLESSALRNGKVVAEASETNLFIKPDFSFQVVDTLVTNFHLPESTLLVLVCAFAGYQRVLAAYRQAVENQYRFYSFGDAMVLSRAK